MNDNQAYNSSLDQKKKAKAFFKRANELAESGNYDYSIKMYLDGIACDPDNIKEGHIPLRELAITRSEKGGKKPSAMEKLKNITAKLPIQKLLHAELLLAKNPMHLAYAETLLKAAIEAGLNDTSKWIADLLFFANNNSPKPSASLYVLLKDSYSAIGLYERAIAALHLAVKLKPKDEELAEEFKRLEAEQTVARGKYDTAENFRESIKDSKSQHLLHAQDSVVKTEDYRIIALKNARQQYKRDPQSNKYLMLLVDKLADIENDAYDDEAMELLKNRYESSKDFSFMLKAGKINITKAKRHVRNAQKQIEKKPQDPDLKQNLINAQQKFDQVELEHFQICVDNYPTNSNYKYELGLRLIKAKKLDQAIPLLQEARNDPKLKIRALDKIGFCFFKKQWFQDAADIFNQAIQSYNIADDNIAKEMKYNLARAYEALGDDKNALDVYRKIAQIDFAFKDVQQRVENLRNKQ